MGLQDTHKREYTDRQTFSGGAAFNGAPLHDDPKDASLLRKKTSIKFQLSDFTDGGSTAGSADFADKLPKGFVPVMARIQMSALSGGSNHTLAVGTGSDQDAIFQQKTVTASTDLLDFVASNSNANPGAMLDAVKDLSLTLYEDADFGNITEASGTVEVFGYQIA